MTYQEAIKRCREMQDSKQEESKGLNGTIKVYSLDAEALEKLIGVAEIVYLTKDIEAF